MKGTILGEYINIGKINIGNIGNIGDDKHKIITNELILTYERLNKHILLYHQNEYYQLQNYIESIITYPDIVLEDKDNKDTLIFLKHIKEIDKKARIVIKLATDYNEKVYNKNSIITIMRQRDKSWEQTLKNKGKIIFQKELDKNE